MDNNHTNKLIKMNLGVNPISGNEVLNLNSKSNNQKILSRQATKNSKRKKIETTFNSAETNDVLNLNCNKKRKKRVTFAPQLCDIVLITDLRDILEEVNSEAKPAESTALINTVKNTTQTNNPKFKSEEDLMKEMEETIKRKFNHKEFKNNCTACCNIF